MSEDGNDTLADVRLTLEIGLDNLENAIYQVNDLHTRAALVVWQRLIQSFITTDALRHGVSDNHLKEVAAIAWRAGGIFVEESKHHVEQPTRIPDDDIDGVDLSKPIETLDPEGF